MIKLIASTVNAAWNSSTLKPLPDIILISQSFDVNSIAFNDPIILREFATILSNEDMEQQIKTHFPNIKT